MNILPKDFNINSYKLLNNDLKDLNNNELIDHYLKYGINEGRLYKNNLPEDFNLKEYKDLNNDLKDLNNNELIDHYLKYGINEGRLYKNNLPEDFNLKAYRNLNNDLKDLNDTELVYHYLNYGVNEDRKYISSLPKDFDLESYKSLNNDLKGLNNDELISHYLINGINEGRIYKNNNNLPLDFNYYTYKTNYYDELYNFNKDNLINHYINYGINENRIYNELLYPDKFDWKFYINITNINNINNENKAFEHCKKNYNIDLFLVKNVLIYDSINIDKFMNENNNYKNKIDAFNFIINNDNNNDNNNDSNNNNSNNKIHFIKNINLTNININININNQTNIIISLSILPNRILNKEFENCLEYLLNQNLKPKYIIINYCTEYKRIKNIDSKIYNDKILYFKNKYQDNIIFNETIDYGPITKALGLIHLPDNIKSNIKDNDKIIIIDDDWKYNNLLTYYYELCYSLYNCDAVFIDESKIINWNNNIEIISKENIFYDNYSGFAYGWLSFSFKYKYLNQLRDIYNELLKIDENIFYHDDLVFTIFYKKLKLYSCGMNLFFPINDIRLLEYIDGLRLIDNSYNIRFNLEKKILKLYNILIENNNNSIKIVDNTEYNNNFIIDNFIEKRELLYEINEISYLPNENNYEEFYFDLKYINRNIFLLTVTNFSDLEKELNFKFKYNNIRKNIIIEKYKYKKVSFFIKVPFYINSIKHLNRDEKIIQTYEINNISRNRFYSISTILNKLPDFRYIFFDNLERINFINQYYPNIISLYNKVNCGAYKADLFRIMYLYKNGGIYFDCKNILFNNLKDILLSDEVYARDHNNGICNGFIYIKFSNNEIMRKYLLEILYNFYKGYYFENNELGALKISGPQCFSKFIHNNYCVKLYNYIYNNKWQNSLFINNNEEKKILIKISYNGYYNENNYVNTNHYGIMWKDKKIYNDLIINYNKINFIDAIVWINLDRSINRKNNMENILKNINIPNYRISAIDGKDNSVQNLLQGINLARNMSNSEIGCTLSHIKAITFLSELNGNYFMVCEDDIEIRNINFIKDNLKDIINKCPEFDILILHKIYIHVLNEEFINWNEHLNRLGKDYQIAGAACYIISRSGINKIINLCKFIDTNNFIFNKSYLDVSDIFLYENTNTYVYKYNYISISGIESCIHEEHISHHNKCEEVQDKTMLNNCI